tara:strand:- start:908 stop:1402 length:495 start_codon:yes stop_codon:yes gene_type:complete
MIKCKEDFAIEEETPRSNITSDNLKKLFEEEEEGCIEPDSVIFAPENRQPVSKFKYTPLEVESVFDLKEMFEKGEIYFRWCGKDEEGSGGVGYDKITTENMLICRYEEGRLLKREELNWKEQISEEFGFTYIQKEDSFVQIGCTSSEDMIKFAKRVLELSGELK